MENITLHHAIAKVLDEKGKALKISDLTNEIVERKLYERADGKSITQAIVYNRISRYKKYFKVEGSLLNKHVWFRSRKDQETNRPISLKESVDTYSQILISLYEKIRVKLPSISPNAFNDLFITLYFLIWYYPIKYNLEFDLKKDWINYFDGKFFNTTVLHNDIIQNFVNPFEKEIFDNLFKYQDIVTLFKTNNHSILNLVKEFHEMIYKTYLFQIDVYGFIDIIYSILNRQTIGHNNKYPSSDYITSLFIKLSEIDTTIKIFDPACGYGKLLIAAHQKSPSSKLYGNDFDQNTILYAKMASLINNVDDIHYTNLNCLNEDFKFKFSPDIVLSEAPVGNFEPLTHQWPHSTKSHRYDAAFLEFMLKVVDDKGKILTIIEDGLLTNPSEKLLRKNLIDNDKLEAVISLSSEFFEKENKNRNLSLIILNLNKKRFINNVLFLDTRKFVLYQDERKEVKKIYLLIDLIKDIYFGKETEYKQLKLSKAVITNQQLAENHYSINCKMYTNPIWEKIKKIKNTIPLNELIKPLDLMRGKPTGKFELYIKPENLPKSATSIYLNEQSLKKFRDRTVKGTFFLNRSALLLSEEGKKINPAIFKYTGTSYKLSKVLAYEIDDKKVMPEYLVYMLRHEYTSQQLDAYQAIFSAKRITTYIYNNILIQVPTLEKQKAWLSDIKPKLFARNTLIDFLGDLKLVQTNQQAGEEIVRFSQKYFSPETEITYKQLIELDHNPFTKHDIINNHIIKSDDENQLLLLNNSQNNPLGILFVKTKFEVEYKIYALINAFASFLYNMVEFIRSEHTNQLMNDLNHHVKNMIGSAIIRIGNFVTTEDEGIQNILKSSYIYDQRTIKRKERKHGDKKEDYLSINYLNETLKKIQAHQRFFESNQKLFSTALQEDEESFSLNVILDELCTAYPKIIIDYQNNEELFVVGKKYSLIIALRDLADNAIKYSSEKVLIKVSNSNDWIQINIINDIDITLNKQKYQSLGKRLYKNKKENRYGTGVLNAFKTIDTSYGSIKLLPYGEYKECKVFELIIRLKKEISYGN